MFDKQLKSSEKSFKILRSLNFSIPSKVKKVSRGKTTMMYH